MNPIYNAMMQNPANRPASNMNYAQMNPIQKMNQVMQAMRNPIEIITQAFPDIPVGIRNDASQIMQYLKQTRNISDEQLQQGVINQIPMSGGFNHF